MSDPTTYSQMLAALSAIYAAEPRLVAQETALALLGGASSRPEPPCLYDADIRALLATSPHLAAASILLAHSQLPWGVNPVADRMTSATAGMIAVCTLMDPDGPIFNPDYRLGLVYMRPNSYYPLHNHDADETYVVLAGSALWTAGPDIAVKTAGDMIHHPSLMPHAFRTYDEGFIALWRWSGDINAHSYTFLADPDDV